MMKTTSLIVFLCLALSSGAYAADRYTLEKSHTKILFFVDHLGFSSFIGDFTQFDGAFTFNEKHPETSTIDVTVHPAGIRTDSKDLDEKLMAEDMFDVARYSDVHFKSASIKVTSKNEGVVSGSLTIKDVTKPLLLSVKYNKCGTHPLTKLYVCGFTADSTIKRSDFGLTAWEGFVGDEVKLHFEVEGVSEWRAKQKMKKT